MLFKGKADWMKIAEIKKQTTIPVIGNGDIFTGIDAVNMIKQTNCDGIMLARGLIENPFLVEEVKAALLGIKYIPPSIKKRINTLLKHCKLMIDYLGEEKGILEFRKFTRGYLKGLPMISKLRQKLNTIYSFIAFKKAVKEYCEYYKIK